MENNKMRILAVDDNIINLATIEQELKDKYEVVTVNSGARAIRFLNKEKPDLILLDVQMALMDGIETLKEIRTMEGGALIPVIMLTSKKDRETVIEGTKLGIMDYVLKPFDSQDLHARIDRALKKVGVLPVEDKELYENVKDVQTDLQGGSLRNALLKMEERTVTTETEAKFPISAGEMNARLLYVLNDLQNFKVKEASQKLEDLMRYDIPEAVGKICASAQERLDEFDDEAAEVIQKALAEMKNNLI